MKFGFGIDFLLTRSDLKRNSFRLTSSEIFYEAEIEAMRANESTTMFIDFAHVMLFSDLIQKAISEEYLRFEPFLKNACKRFVMEQKPTFISDDNPNKDINLAFFNLPVCKKLRELNTAEIGKLVSVTGVVTRTSEVRPELLQGTFKCLECGGVIKNVEQQFKYTEVGLLSWITLFLVLIVLFIYFLVCIANNLCECDLCE